MSSKKEAATNVETMNVETETKKAVATKKPVAVLDPKQLAALNERQISALEKANELHEKETSHTEQFLSGLAIGGGVATAFLVAQAIFYGVKAVASND